jgi:hypothetical protein
MGQIMKNTLILIALTFATCGLFAQEGTQQSGFAQAAPDRIQPVRLGFIATPTLNWLSTENRELDSKGVRAGFTFGVMVDFTIAQSPNYAFATGLFMNMANGGNLRYADLQQRAQNAPSEQVMTDANLNFQYMEVPLTLKLKTNEIGYMTYFGQLGVLGGVKLSARQSGEYQYQTEPRNTVLIERENVASDTQLFNAGMLVGIGTEYNITGNTNLVFGISYFHGFTNVLKRNVLSTNEKGEILFNEEGAPVTGDKRRGVLRSLSLNLGVIF